MQKNQTTDAESHRLLLGISDCVLIVFKINANGFIFISKAQMTNSHNVCVLFERNELASLNFTATTVNESSYHLTACIMQISGITLITNTSIISTNGNLG